MKHARSYFVYCASHRHSASSSKIRNISTCFDGTACSWTYNVCWVCIIICYTIHANGSGILYMCCLYVCMYLYWMSLFSLVQCVLASYFLYIQRTDANTRNNHICELCFIFIFCTCPASIGIIDDFILLHVLKYKGILNIEIDIY